MTVLLAGLGATIAVVETVAAGAAAASVGIALDPAWPAVALVAIGVLAAACCAARTDCAHAVTLLAGLVTAAVSAATDALTGLIFDWVVAVGAIVTLSAALLAGDLPSALCGALIAAAPLLVAHGASGGRAMGLGDVKLATVIGASLGPIAAPVALACACIAAGAVSVTLLVSKRKQRGDAIAFGPFLALGAYVVAARW